MKKACVVFHSADMDGWASGWVARKYLHEQGVIDREILYWGYNYTQNTTKLEELLDSHGPMPIFMVDVTLPDWFMEKYAKDIILIDHHRYQVEQGPTKSWWTKLKRNFSAWKMPIYRHINPGTEQIAACELAWMSLFPKRDMPKFIYLSGRYDIWDHNFEVLDFNAYVRYILSEIPHSQQKPLFLSGKFSDLESKFELAAALRDGQQARKWAEKFAAIDSSKFSYFGEINGHKVLISNRDGVSSLWFREAHKQWPEAVACISYGYNPINKVWRVSCYSLSKVDCLGIISYAKDSDTITSFGGHVGACGFTTKDINKDFLNHFVVAKRERDR